MQLEEIEKWSKEQLRNHIDKCFERAAIIGGLERPAVLAEAEFYMKELDRREDVEAQRVRDSIETARWGIDLKNEKIIIGMIGIEILLAIGLAIWGDVQHTQDAKQHIKDMDRQIAAFGDIERGLWNLQETSKGTTGAIDETKTSIEGLNKKMQIELDMYYEPSVYLSFSRDKGANNLELHNNGRTNVTVFAVAVNTNNTCILDEPLPVPFGQSRQLTWEILERRTIEPIFQSGAAQWMALYMRTEDGKEYRTEANLESWSRVYGMGLDVHNLGTIKVDWKREYAEKSKKPAANKKCSLKL